MKGGAERLKCGSWEQKAITAVAEEQRWALLHYFAIWIADFTVALWRIKKKLYNTYISLQTRQWYGFDILTEERVIIQYYHT